MQAAPEKSRDWKLLQVKHKELIPEKLRSQILGEDTKNPE